MKILEFFKTRRTLATILVSALFFCVGVYVGFFNRPEITKVFALSGIETPGDIKADFDPFWKAWNAIVSKSPDADKVTDQEKVYGAISGLVNSLNDPYSVFFTPEDAKIFEDDIAGSFIGIGVEVGIKEGVLTVIAPLKGSPGEKAGVQKGDKILKIDQTETQGFSIEKAVQLIRGKGEKGSTVVLTILRVGEKQTREIKIIRDVITMPTLDAELRSDGIFVIKLYTFSANSSNLFRNAIRKFADSKTDKLILDLRGNPGGYLEAAVNMASWFVPNGKPVIIEDYGDKQKQKVYRSKGYADASSNLKFVILIDGGSASSSEILAGAMQDYGIAKLVGEKSYGKGSVQEIVKVTPDTLLKITVAKWLTPNGISISEKGLTPDYKVLITAKDTAAKKDPQMDKAVELLKNWTAIKKP